MWIQVQALLGLPLQIFKVQLVHLQSLQCARSSPVTQVSATSSKSPAAVEQSVSSSPTIHESHSSSPIQELLVL